MFESRGWYFRGLDYVPAVLHEGSGVLQMIHRARDAKALRCRLETLGITHVVVNTAAVGRYPPVFVERYRPADLQQDILRVQAFLQEWTEPIWNADGIVVARLKPVTGCGEQPEPR
jgi:hypothetical protein